MKKWIVWLVVVLIVLCQAGLAEGNWYVEQGLQLAERVIELAGDETYAQMYDGTGDIQEVVAEFAASDFSEVMEARMLSLPDAKSMKTIMKVMAVFSGDSVSEMSPLAQQELFRKIPGMLISMVNNRQGYAWLGATSILRTSETHVMPEDFQPGVLLLEYPGKYSVAVAFSRTGDVTVTAEATAVYSGFANGADGEMSLLERLAIDALFRKIDLE